MRPFMLIPAIALAMSACAKSPDAIAPAAMPSGMFDGVSCQQARDARARSAARLAQLESDQRSAVAGDAVGVFLVGIPLSSVAGGNREGLLAVEKGRLLSLDARLERC